MKGDIAGTRLGEIGDDAVNRLDHQVHIDGRGYTVFAQRLAHQRTDGQIRYVVIVHDIEMDNICTGLEDIGHFLTQTGKVGGENGGGNPGCIHGDGSLKNKSRGARTTRT